MNAAPTMPECLTLVDEARTRSYYRAVYQNAYDRAITAGNNPVDAGRAAVIEAADNATADAKVRDGALLVEASTGRMVVVVEG